MQNDDVRRTQEGAQALENRIIAEAKAEVEAVIQEARVRAQQIQEEGERETARIAMEAETLSQRNENEILAKHRTQAELESKKHALKMRHTLIDRVFQAAYRKVWEIDPRDERVVRFIHRTLLTEARGGETVLPAARHRDAVRIALGRVNEKLAQSNRPPLTLGDTAQGLTGGFILDGGTYKKDCSLAAIMDDVREREIVAVANMLFHSSTAQKAARPATAGQTEQSEPTAQTAENTEQNAE